MTRGVACALVCGLILAGCSGGWFGGSEEEAPLPGERIPIMTLDQTLEPDARIANLEGRLPPPYVNTAWSQAGGTPSHALYHVALDEGPRVAWRAGVGTGSSSDGWILAQPLVVEDRVYTMDAGARITAFGADRGKRLWEVDLEIDEEDEGYFGGGIAYDSGRLYVTTGFGMAFALNAEDGQTIWSQRLPGPSRAAVRRCRSMRSATAMR